MKKRVLYDPIKRVGTREYALGLIRYMREYLGIKGLEVYEKLWRRRFPKGWIVRSVR